MWFTSLWGLFCACSWTWCIGMYLPRIMIDRFGWPGFMAFAVPNVLGCAAFGYVIKGRVPSLALIARHGGAMLWFSIITIAYHMFFMVWLLDGLIDLPAELFFVPLATAAIVLCLGGVFSFLPDRDWLALGLLVYGVSIAALLWIGVEPLQAIQWTGGLKSVSLWWLMPTLFFGFFLCPYLDLTFHRAIQNSPSPHAFAVFGVAFFIMLLLTCVIWFAGSGFDGRWLPAIALAHILVQSAFTVGAHWREIRLSSVSSSRAPRLIILCALFAVAAMIWAVRLWWKTDELGEILYLRFLVFYGLAFPAYVLLIMVSRTVIPKRAALLGWAAIVIASLPFYEFGFIRNHTWLLTIPLAAMLLLGAWRWRTPPQERTPGRAGG